MQTKRSKNTICIEDFSAAVFATLQAKTMELIEVPLPRLTATPVVALTAALTAATFR